MCPSTAWEGSIGRRDGVISIAVSATLYFRLFFFSSRRRHTRWNCDWSSDVCSSDLIERSDLSTVFAEPEFFGLLGLHPLAGRLPNELDVRAHEPGNLLVSAAFAAERFGDRKSVV